MTVLSFDQKFISSKLTLPWEPAQSLVNKKHQHARLHLLHIALTRSYALLKTFCKQAIKLINALVLYGTPLFPCTKFYRPYCKVQAIHILIRQISGNKTRF